MKAKKGDNENVKDTKLKEKGDVRRATEQHHDGGSYASGRWGK